MPRLHPAETAKLSLKNPRLHLIHSKQLTSNLSPPVLSAPVKLFEDEPFWAGVNGYIEAYYEKYGDSRKHPQIVVLGLFGGIDNMVRHLNYKGAVKFNHTARFVAVEDVSEFEEDDNDPLGSQSTARLGNYLAVQSEGPSALDKYKLESPKKKRKRKEKAREETDEDGNAMNPPKQSKSKRKRKRARE